jgi:hypothetical protein
LAIVSLYYHCANIAVFLPVVLLDASHFAMGAPKPALFVHVVFAALWFAAFVTGEVGLPAAVVTRTKQHKKQ